MACRHPLVLVGAVCLGCSLGATRVCADVRIDKVVVDDRTIDGGASGADRPLIRLSANARQVEIHVVGAADPAAPARLPRPETTRLERGTRLRFRLDGVDGEYRDAPAKARVLLQFFDADGNVIDSAEAAVHGESAGWRGAPEDSDFIHYEVHGIAPALASRASATFLSHGGDDVVGQIGIDDVEISVAGAGRAAQRHPLPILADEPFHPLGTPAGWTRRGSRGEMAQLRERAALTPHPILVLLDDDPHAYGNWSTTRRVPVSPGDRVTLAWSAAHSLGRGDSVVATYPELRPGAYWFRAVACRPGGEPTGAEADMRIEVVAPWHARPEAWVVGVALALAAALAVGRSVALRRIRRRLEETERAHALERERTRIARDLHDEVGAALTEIAMQHYWVERELSGLAPQATLERVERARQSAVDLVRSVDAIVWAVNPANDTLDRFVPYLTHSVEQFLDSAQVRAVIDVPDHLPALALDGGVRHALFLTIREAVNNAVKHGHPETVWLSMRVAASAAATRLHITVDDDGRGCAAADRHEPRAEAGSGLENMRRRIAELGGCCEIGPRPGGGTRVAIEVALPVAAPHGVS